GAGSSTGAGSGEPAPAGQPVATACESLTAAGVSSVSGGRGCVTRRIRRPAETGLDPLTGPLAGPLAGPLTEPLRSGAGGRGGSAGWPGRRPSAARSSSANRPQLGYRPAGSLASAVASTESTAAGSPARRALAAGGSA